MLGDAVSDRGMVIGRDDDENPIFAALLVYGPTKADLAALQKVMDA